MCLGTVFVFVHMQNIQMWFILCGAKGGAGVLVQYLRGERFFSTL